MKYLDIRFYGRLRDLLPCDRQSGLATRTFDVERAVGDIVEACGVPHAEVALVLVNGEAVDFSHEVENGDFISVYPPFCEFEIDPSLSVSPPPVSEYRFALDGHLDDLAGYLRLLGFDSVCNAGWTDAELVEIATSGERVLLTSDPRLLMHRTVRHGYVVRAIHPGAQLAEVLLRFDLVPA